MPYWYLSQQYSSIQIFKPDLFVNICCDNIIVSKYHYDKNILKQRCQSFLNYWNIFQFSPDDIEGKCHIKIYHGNIYSCAYYDLILIFLHIVMCASIDSWSWIYNNHCMNI